jgi:predicted glycoside hydrolase/deacetylase ChbG (UPF0249 family)
MRRVVIVNADDFGQSAGVNGGIIEAHERGIVTSASLLVRGAAAAAAAGHARSTPRLSVGLHVDLGEWRRVDWVWEPVYEVVDVGDAAAVTAELGRQLDAFVELVGRPPTHLDSHQHVHREEPVRSALAASGAALGVPVRELTPGITYSGAFWPTVGVDVESLLTLLASLPPGVTEVGCHPGADEHEVDTLCDPRVRALLDADGIELASFADVAELVA